MITKKWNEFWFCPVPLINLAMFRIVISVTLFFMYLIRQRDLELFFTDQGILPKALALKALPEFYRPFVILSFWPDSMVPVVHGFFLMCLALFALGVGGRIIGIICAFLHLAFLQRNYGVAFGADQIGGIFLLYLAFTNCCARLSVLNLKRNRLILNQSQDLLTPLFYRMIQVQLCVIYAYTGLEKLKGSSWWDGTALWSVFANPQMVVVDLTWMSRVPLVIAAITFSTIVFEIYFTPLVWNIKTRKYVLMAGVAFHLSIGILMALYSFAAVMMAPYLLFLRPTDLARLLKRFSSLARGNY